MEIVDMLAELRTQRDQMDEAIMTLERIARGRGKRRGRPPLWMTEAKKGPQVSGGRRGRPPGSKNKVSSEAKTA